MTNRKHRRGKELEQQHFRVGEGHDVHRLVENRSLILGGVTIPFDRGLAGHSDADVLLHAICDALLGGCGLGDIGEHFPDTDPQWKGVDSAELLKQVVGEVKSRGWRIGNLDCTIFAQQPKLSTHKAAIRQNVAGLLQIDEDQTNIKAKTGEEVGPIGRQEAIAATAIVLLVRAEVFDTVDD